MRVFRLVLAILFIAAAPAAAGEPVTLTDAVRAHIAEQASIAGAPVARDHLDGKVVVISFFASWCPPCRIEFAHLNELRATYAVDDVTVIAINLFEDWGGFEDDGRRRELFLLRTGPSFSVIGSNEETADIFGGVTRIPTAFVFDRDGNPALHFVHEVNAEITNPAMADLEAAIEEALYSQRS